MLHYFQNIVSEVLLKLNENSLLIILRYFIKYQGSFYVHLDDSEELNLLRTLE